jgi:predicted O-methyltransferase YrrM
MSEMQKAWVAAGLNPDNYSAACADAMKIYNQPFYDLLVGYMEWEAMLIEDNAMWWPSVPKDRISGKSYDKMMELQSKRNELLSR